MESKAFEFGPFRLEVRERRLTRDGHPVHLRGRVFDTLYVLVKRHGCLVTKDELMAAVWPESVVEETNLNHNICVLRRALGEKVTDQKYVETVARQGYRFVADVKEFDVLEEPSHLNSWDIERNNRLRVAPGSQQLIARLDSQPEPEVPNSRQEFLPPGSASRHRRWIFTSLLVVAAFLAVGYVGMERLAFKGADSNPRIMLAVLPFENLTGDSTQEYIADGLSHEIISELGRWNPAQLGVISRTSSKVYLGAHKSISEIGRELGVDYIVEGSVRRSGGYFRITVMLVRVDNQAQLWAANYDQEFDDITALQVKTTQVIIREIGSRIDVKPREGARIVDPRGFDDSLNVKNRSAIENTNSAHAPARS